MSDEDEDEDEDGAKSWMPDDFDPMRDAYVSLGLTLLKGLMEMRAEQRARMSR